MTDPITVIAAATPRHLFLARQIAATVEPPPRDQFERIAMEHAALAALVENERAIVEWLLDPDRCPFGKSPLHYAEMIQQGWHRRDG